MILTQTQIIKFRALTYFENDQDKTVITFIQSVLVTRPTMSNLGAIRANPGPDVRAWQF